MNRSFLLIGAISGFLTVALGAFGAHLLKGTLEPRLYAAFQTGVEYQGVHTLALLFIALAADRVPAPWLNRSGWLLVTGTLLFSGSLYLLAITGIKSLGMITPVGGITLLAAWLSLAMAAWQMHKETPG